MADAPRVSVVLPVHNRRELVRRAIDSVLAQTMSDFELLVIDDCSTDATADVVEEYCSDPRVTLFRNQTNLGPAGARNRGIELARGHYIAFQDSDDRWFPEKLSQQVSALERNPEHQACFCGALYYSQSQCYYIPREGTLDVESAASGDLSTAVLYSNPATPQTMLVKAILFDKVGGFNAALKINEDWDLVIRMAQQARFAFVAEPLVVIYRTADSVSSDRLADTAARERLLTEYAGLIAQHPMSRARQNYIVGSQSIEFQDYGNAVRYFRRAFRDAPSFRSFLQIQRAWWLALSHALTRAAK